MIRVLIADDHQLVRQGISLLLDKAEDIQIVGQARNGYEAVQMTSEALPDVVLMDADMPRLDGFEATRIIRSSGFPTQVIMLTMLSDENMQQKARQSGAQAYVLKNANREELLAAIRTIRESPESRQ
ncbi:MAG: response regulator transcription factor [Chloroflexi bacterium]|nr:response regulator transcription factor [Chloroflexota bacterium]